MQMSVMAICAPCPSFPSIAALSLCVLGNEALPAVDKAAAPQHFHLHASISRTRTPFVRPVCHISRFGRSVITPTLPGTNFIQISRQSSTAHLSATAAPSIILFKSFLHCALLRICFE
ncbi:hypothetical protein B0J12DRAFT_686209 [Macrophomina phaseolina]|uniref:Secreted protein n=1 Tax=Macrophomina phaseolina TaxID=35725 RepID=A0ABQ8FTD6_9PEZI|nr:hypothetical protein B0J12DRAFT_686209 [Macrophomina phaseolina]